MANIASAKKRARQTEKHRQHNMAYRSKFRSCLKRIDSQIEKGDKDAANAAYKEALPIIDRMSNKGLIHRNKAARHKSRLNARIQAL